MIHISTILLTIRVCLSEKAGCQGERFRMETQPGQRGGTVVEFREQKVLCGWNMRLQGAGLRADATLPGCSADGLAWAAIEILLEPGTSMGERPRRPL